MKTVLSWLGAAGLAMALSGTGACETHAEALPLIEFGDGGEVPSAKELAEVIFGADALEGRRFPVITARGVYGVSDDPTIAATLAENLVDAVCSSLKPEKGPREGIPQARILRLLRLRELILDAGSYGNSCLAGSLSQILNAYVLEQVCRGSPISGPSSSIGKGWPVDLQKVLECLDRSSNFESEKPATTLSRLALDAAYGRAFLKILTSLGGKVRVWTSAQEEWVRIGSGQKLHFNFDRHNLLNPSTVSHLLAWGRAIDEQRLITVVSGVAKDHNSLLQLRIPQDWKEIKRLLGAAMAEAEEFYSCVHLVPFSAHMAYELVREMGGLTQGVSPLKKRCSAIQFFYKGF